MATTHTRDMMYALFPDKVVMTYNCVHKERYCEPEIDFSTFWPKTIENRGMGYGLRMALRDESVLDLADIFVETADQEKYWTDDILKHLNPKTTIVLNRNLRDWLMSQLNFFEMANLGWHGLDISEILGKFFDKNLLYSRLEKYNFKTINVSSRNLNEELISHYGHQFPENMPHWDKLLIKQLFTDRMNVTRDVPEDMRKRHEEIVDKMLQQLEITPREENLPCIPRFT